METGLGLRGGDAAAAANVPAGDEEGEGASRGTQPEGDDADPAVAAPGPGVPA